MEHVTATVCNSGCCFPIVLPMHAVLQTATCSSRAAPFSLFVPCRQRMALSSGRWTHCPMGTAPSCRHPTRATARLRPQCLRTRRQRIGATRTRPRAHRFPRDLAKCHAEIRAGPSCRCLKNENISLKYGLDLYLT